MFDVMTRLKVHNMAEGGTSQADISAICGVPIRSVQRIVAEMVPTREEVIAGEMHDAPRRGRPPKADAAMIERIRSLFADEKNAHLNAMEVLRRAKGWGYTGGRSQMTALVKSLRPVPRKDPRRRAATSLPSAPTHRQPFHRGLVPSAGEDAIPPYQDPPPCGGGTDPLR